METIFWSFRKVRQPAALTNLIIQLFKSATFTICNYVQILGNNKILSTGLVVIIPFIFLILYYFILCICLFWSGDREAKYFNNKKKNNFWHQKPLSPYLTTFILTIKLAVHSMHVPLVLILYSLKGPCIVQTFQKLLLTAPFYSTIRHTIEYIFPIKLLIFIYY